MILRRFDNNDCIRNDAVSYDPSTNARRQNRMGRKPAHYEDSPTSTSQFPTTVVIDDVDVEVGNAPVLPLIDDKEPDIESNGYVVDEKEIIQVEDPVDITENASIVQLGQNVEQSVTNADDHVVIDKPFFVMDFLEDVDQGDLELVQNLLQKEESIRCGSNKPARVLPLPLLLPPLLLATSNGSCADMQLPTPAVVSLTPKTSGSKRATDTNTSTCINIADTPSASVKKSASRSSNTFFDRSVAIGSKYNARGICFASKGDWIKALQCWQDALEIRTQVLGESLDVANTCNNIGIALGKLHRYAEAIVVLQRAISIRIAHYGWNHEIVAATLHNMGNVYQQQRTQRKTTSTNSGEDSAEVNDDNSVEENLSLDSVNNAIYCFREAACILEQLYGRNNAEVARSLVALGHTYNQANAPDHARGAYLDALQIFECIGYTLDHPEVQSIVDDLYELD
jgi:tetratricopeptide (TPR) repeat protein